MDRCVQDCGCLPAEVSHFSAPARPTERGLIVQLLAHLDHPDERIDQVVIGRRFLAIRAGSRVGLSSTLGVRPDSRETRLIRELTSERLAPAARLLEDESLFAGL